MQGKQQQKYFVIKLFDLADEYKNKTFHKMTQIKIH